MLEALPLYTYVACPPWYSFSYAFYPPLSSLLLTGTQESELGVYVEMCMPFILLCPLYCLQERRNPGWVYMLNCVCLIELELSVLLLNLLFKLCHTWVLFWSQAISAHNNAPSVHPSSRCLTCYTGMEDSLEQPGKLTIYMPRGCLHHQPNNDIFKAFLKCEFVVEIYRIQ